MRDGGKESGAKSVRFNAQFSAIKVFYEAHPLNCQRSLI